MSGFISIKGLHVTHEPRAGEGADSSTNNSTRHTDEAALVAQLQAGDQEAYRTAVAKYSPRMLATARAIVGPAQAEDVVQEAWVTVFRQIGKFEQRSALSTWLQRIVANGAISHLRKQKKEASSDTSQEQPPDADWFDSRGRWVNPPVAWDTSTPDDLLTAADLQDCIDKHIALMSDQQRQVLVMRDMQSQSFDDICNDLGVTASNVRVLLHRGRTRLMKMVDHFQETGTC
ncbi:MAG: RNA polymerase sigma factor [Gammaproteobacteria bacterium]|nr:RNA polymerase sigma factor [Gammaproteobacteria bacterium]